MARFDAFFLASTTLERIGVDHERKYGNVSIGRLFAACLVPGLLMAIGLMCQIWWQAERQSDRDGSPDVFVMNADGSEQVNLTAHDSSNIDPSFSSDGSRIAFDSDRDGNLEIYVMDADGSNQTRLTETEAVDSHPFFSPVADRIAFYSNRDNPESENMDIYVMDADGGNVTRLTDDAADDRYPSWSPDGRRLTFSSDRDGNPEIYVMDADGENVRV